MPAIRSLGRGRIRAQNCCRRDKLRYRIGRSIPVFGPIIRKAAKAVGAFARPTLGAQL
jgi:hypothetical protein